MLDFDRFEVLTLDCYGTLINWEAGLLPVIRRVLAAHKKQLDDATILKLYGDFELASEQGEFLVYSEVLRSVIRRFGDELGFVPAADEVNSLPRSLPGWKPWPDTVAALRELKRRFRLAIISNVDDDLFSYTRPQLGVDFDEVITAQQAQAYKPSEEIFKLALARVNASKGRVLHVGQSAYHDVIPAQALGLATVWVKRPSARTGGGAVKAAQATPDLEVSSVAELAEAVQASAPRA